MGKKSIFIKMLLISSLLGNITLANASTNTPPVSRILSTETVTPEENQEKEAKKEELRALVDKYQKELDVIKLKLDENDYNTLEQVIAESKSKIESDSSSKQDFESCITKLNEAYSSTKESYKTNKLNPMLDRYRELYDANNPETTENISGSILSTIAKLDRELDIINNGEPTFTNFFDAYQWADALVKAIPATVTRNKKTAKTSLESAITKALEKKIISEEEANVYRTYKDEDHTVKQYKAKTLELEKKLLESYINEAKTVITLDNMDEESINNLKTVLNSSENTYSSSNDISEITTATNNLKDALDVVKTKIKEMLSEAVTKAEEKEIDVASEKAVYESDTTIPEYKKALDSINEKFKINLNDNKYDEIISSLDKISTSISDNLDDNYFLNLSLGKYFDKNNILNDLSLGANFKVVDNFKIGLFTEINIDEFNTYAFGIGSSYSIKGHNLKDFFRYRLLKKDSIENNNLDLYIRYAYNYEKSNFKLSPSLAILGTYSFKTKLDTNVELSEVLKSKFDFSTKVSYYGFFVEPILSVRIQSKQLLKQLDEENTREIKKEGIKMLDFNVNLGYEYMINDIILKAKLETGMNKYAKVSLGISLNK